MSYWVSLVDPTISDITLQSQIRRAEGGTQVLGGTHNCELNITWNYSHVYNLLGFSIRDLDGEPARATYDRLTEVVEKLGTNQYHQDYWAPTPGNAGYALSILLEWAEEHPYGIWKVC